MGRTIAAPSAGIFLGTAIRGYRTVTASLDGEVRDGRHHMQVRIYFEDTDAGQIVYHANFVRFTERGRTNYLRLLGNNQQELLKEGRNDAPGFAFVVRSMTIDFLKPAVLDDLLDVVTVPQEVRGASIAGLEPEPRQGQGNDAALASNSEQAVPTLDLGIGESQARLYRPHPALP
jgi:acyl-CoA thioester hydrolase